jgi:hypothetical protein
MIDILLIAVLGVVTWFVSSEGAWSAGVTFVSVLLAGLLAMNFFEPLAIILGNQLPAYDNKMDMIALIGLFGGFVFLMRLAGERMAPTYVQVPALIEQGGRWLFGLGAGYVSMALLLTALHTAPIPREFLGFSPERNNLLNIAAPDRQWLAFTQYVTEHAYARRDVGVMLGAPFGSPHAFDAPYFTISEGTTTYPNTTWASFPIRYAMRREQYGMGGGVAAVPGAPVPGQAPVVPTPVPVQPGGGGGGAGTAVF